MSDLKKINYIIVFFLLLFIFICLLVRSPLSSCNSKIERTLRNLCAAGRRAQEPIEEEAMHSWRTTGVLELDALTALSAQVSALANQVQNLNMQGHVKAVEPRCEWCGQGHSTGQCTTDQVNYVGNFNMNNNPYSNTYNAGWCNNPNFSWNNSSQSVAVPNNPPPPSQHYQPLSTTTTGFDPNVQFHATNYATIYAESATTTTTVYATSYGAIKQGTK